MRKVLEFKWSVSRGQETYGYNICSLYVDGKKVSSCSGGGYDMQGTAFAQWVQKEYQAQLASINHRAHNLIDANYHYEHKGDLYGMSAYLDASGNFYKVALDGGCGFDSMRTIVRAIGLTLEYVSKHRDNSTYILRDSNG